MAVRCFDLEVPSPFRLDLTVWALRRRAHNALDGWDGACYRRTAFLGGRPAALAVRQASGAERAGGFSRLTVEMCSASGLPDDAQVVEARLLLARTLGLGVDLTGFYALAERDHRLAPLARRFVGMRPPLLPSVFEALVNAVACQQLSLSVGIHLLNRLTRAYGPTVAVERDAPAGFPTPEALARADPHKLRSLGFSQAKARTLIVVAGRAATGQVDLAGLSTLDDKAAVATLVGLAGIGRWSAEYTLLRGLGRWHVMPGDDVGARNHLRRLFGLAGDAGYSAVAALAQKWWPYGGIVYFHLLLDGLHAGGQLEDAEAVGAPPPPPLPPPEEADRRRGG